MKATGLTLCKGDSGVIVTGESKFFLGCFDLLIYGLRFGGTFPLMLLLLPFSIFKFGKTGFAFACEGGAVVCR